MHSYLLDETGSSRSYVFDGKPEPIVKVIERPTRKRKVKTAKARHTKAPEYRVSVSGRRRTRHPEIIVLD